MSDQPESITPAEKQAARLTALVLGELSEEEQQQVEAELNASLREDCDNMERAAVAVLKSDRVAPLPEPSAALREAVESKLADAAVSLRQKEPLPATPPRRRSWLVFATSLALLLAIVAIPYVSMYNLYRDPKTELAQIEIVKDANRAEAIRADGQLAAEQAARRFASAELERQTEILRNLEEDVSRFREEIRIAQQDSEAKLANAAQVEARIVATAEPNAESSSPEAIVVTSPQPTPTSGALPNATPFYVTPPAAGVEIVRSGRALGTQAVPPSNHLAAGPTARGAGIVVTERGSTTRHRGRSGAYGSGAEPDVTYGGSAMIGGMYGEGMEGVYGGEMADGYGRGYAYAAGSEGPDGEPLAKRHSDRTGYGVVPQAGSSGLPGRVANEQYSPIVENRFVSVTDEPLSTFSIDVDTASYANARRFLSQNQVPPANAIRIEEFVNYFSYDYPAPKKGEPFSVNMEVAECPWQPAHRLVRIGLKGKELTEAERPASNVVFLLDVSGSMQDANKLPLLKQAMKLLTDQLSESDRVSIVTYAGNAGLALDTTIGENKQTIRDAIDALNANGSTNGSAGIQLAYEKATESFIKDGANRVILATDGDLNVGVTDDDALVTFIKEKASSGVFLTVLGFGEGNLKDGKLEKLADNGNGMYAYIDSLREARKVLVEQITGSLVTIAKDVKIKVEFNPAEVAAYRLLGYENRLMPAPDFDNDAKDAGEIGAGHTVTALYEIVPAKLREQLAATSLSLKYQRTAAPAEPPQELTPAAQTGELLTLFLRYKQPDADESTLSEFTVASKHRAFDDASADFRFAAAVASFGMVLRNSEFRGNSSLAAVEEIASSAIGRDPQGHRTELLDLVRKASALQQQRR